MGRKKKVQPVQTSGIAYEGKVTVKQIKGNRILKTNQTHNQGTRYLFEFICNCLCGNYDDSRSPKYIQILKSNGGTPVWDNDHVLTTSPQPIQSASPDSGTNSATSNLKFIVPGANIRSGEDGDVIALYNTVDRNSISKPLAYVILSSTQKIRDIPADVNILVEWELKVSNAQVSQ